MCALWLLSVVLKDVSIVDLFWGVGFVIIAWATFLVAGHSNAYSYLFLAMVTLWGLRLSVHLAKRNIGKGEDSRYVAMRNHRGSSFVWSSLWIVFGLQGAIMLLVALPIQVGLINDSAAINAGVIVAALVWGTGLGFEAIGDYQLSRFKSDDRNKGKVLNRGLWRYTRHPNYFGDALVWWGFYGFAVSVGSGWWTIFSPLMMTVLLMRVSGVSLMEKTIEERRPEYAEYKRETSSFFPLPPKRIDVPS